MKKRRRGIWALLLLAALLLEQQVHLQVVKTEVWSNRLPEGFDGFRIVLLTDLHGRRYGPESGYLLKEVERQRPDLIAVAGDLAEEDGDVPWAADLLRGLSEIAPTIFVTGNHEWSLSDVRGTLKAFRQAGAVVLENQSFLLKKGEDSILIAGVDDPCGPRDMISPAELGKKLRAGAGDCFFLLLAHRNDPPEYWESTTADLVLSGHGHGGLLRLPLYGGVFRRGQCDSGLYRSGNTQLYVSRGLGGKGVRLGNRPEISLLILRKS